MNSPRHPLSALLLCGLLVLIPNVLAYAGSATWNLNPTSGDWNTAANWTPATVPNGLSDTATFAASNQTTVSLSAITEVNGIVFDADASAFTITASASSILGSILSLRGAGITNNSGVAQNFVTAVCGCGGTSGLIQFTNSATAGTSTIFTNNAAIASGGVSGVMEFLGTSTAGDGAFTNNGGTVSGASGGGTEFVRKSSAGNAMITSNGGAVSSVTEFYQRATAANATLIANGGLNGGGASAILFLEDSTGGTARVKVFGNGQMYIATHNAPGVTIGSLEGTGSVSLGANNLSVGSNNLSTVFSGAIQDGGSFTKIGTGTLTLANANTYTGGTTIKGGKLVVNNMSGSGTGSGAVQVNAGTLGGRGTITGGVTVGTGRGADAVLAPGRRGGKPGNPLTILSTLTFNSDATYDCGLSTKGAIADQVVANGVTISSAFFSFVASGGGVLPSSTVFTVINNTATTPISGTFSNLADGSTFTVGSNTFQADYEGGDGNDLTLTVQ